MGETQLNLPELSGHLSDLFGVHPIDDVQQLQGGYKCQNFRLQCGPEVFFLKQYRYRVSHWVAEMKYAEAFFAGAGLPVILPLSDRFNRPMFLVGEYWYSLFPFVNACQPARGHVHDATVRSLGRWLGRFHLAGKTMPRDTFQILHGWDREAFRMEFVELERRSAMRMKEYPFLEKVMETLRRKAMVVERNHVTPHAIPLAFDCLLHGDFTYQNVFVDANGELTHVFDMEKTCRGPRAYELARSLLISCFDTSWGERNFEQGRMFLKAYREAYPISFEEFYQGMRMYMIGVAHSTWVEARLVLGTGDGQHEALFASHALRIKHVTDDPRAFCEMLYS
jgi:Ser/Thr protein kinase RdoA (MazF antagonist)